MGKLDELVLESTSYREDMEEYISGICFQINKINANYPCVSLDELTYKLVLLIKYCDSVIVDNENNKTKLDLSLKEAALLSSKLDEEKKLRVLDFDRSLHLNEIEIEGNIILKEKVKDLEGKLNVSMKNISSLLEKKHELEREIKSVTELNNTLAERVQYKDITLTKLKLEINTLKDNIIALESRSSWSTDKWVDDSVLSSYFSAIEKSINRNDILFLGPSVTLTIRFSSPDTCMEILKLTTFNKCKFVFLCLSDCSAADRDDGGSHWSLLFLDITDNKAYHFDSMQSMNNKTALIVAKNLGVTSQVIEMPCIQQKDTFECGIHVLANTKYIAYHYCTRNTTDMSLLDWMNGADVNIKTANSKMTPLMTEPKQIIKKTHHKSDTWMKVCSKKNSYRNGKSMIKECTNYTNFTKNKFEILEQTAFRNENHGCVDGNNHCIDRVRRETKILQSTCNALKQIPNMHSTLAPSNESNHKIIVASDSQGRGLSGYLCQNSKNNKINICNYCKPNAPMKYILESVRCSDEFTDLLRGDCVVLIGGTNDILRHSTTYKSNKTFLEEYKTLLEDQLEYFKHTNVILATIPYRYDQAADSSENDLIKQVNFSIRELIYDLPNVQLLDVYLLQSWCHTRHGLHLNRRGKKVISKEIIKMTEKMLNNSAFVQPIPVIPNNKTSCKKGPDLRGRDQELSANNLKGRNEWGENDAIIIKESNLIEEIEQNQDNPLVAFSHCISGDFGSRRQMSGGAAVVFRKKFGLPKHSDKINDYLTIQQPSIRRAGVYGLVTKKVFSGKPLLQDYDEAFYSLTRDFKKKNFKKLICTPMGCIRDKIPPQNFAKNIVSFHKKTRASVVIVVSDERATRNLRNGLEYQDFLDLLQTCIAEEMRKCDIQRRGNGINEVTDASDIVCSAKPFESHIYNDSIETVEVMSRDRSTSPGFLSMDQFPPLYSTTIEDSKHATVNSTSIVDSMIDGYDCVSQPLNSPLTSLQGKG